MYLLEIVKCASVFTFDGPFDIFICSVVAFDALDGLPGFDAVVSANFICYVFPILLNEQNRHAFFFRVLPSVLEANGLLGMLGQIDHD